jgi:hypothetical protein
MRCNCPRCWSCRRLSDSCCGTSSVTAELVHWTSKGEGKAVRCLWESCLRVLGESHRRRLKIAFDARSC